MKRGAPRLIAAAVLSVAAHAALLAGSWLTPPETVPESPPLSARLQAQAPAPAQRPAPPQQPPPVRPAAATPPAVIAGAAADTTATPAESISSTAAPAAEPVVVASAAPTTFKAPEPPPLPSFPRKGRITYQLTMGPEQTPVGRTVQTWAFEGGQYKLGSQSESTGLIEIFRPHRFHYLSQGTVSGDGLRPERFLASIKRGSHSEEALAVFNWDEGRVRLGRMPQQTTVPLPAGSQDVISFMYQLALAPPAPGRITLPFTRGPRLDTATFEVLNPETIETPLGRLRTIPVVQVREPGHESMAVWLATDYRNLPVRIRFFNREGELSGEQLVSEIQVSEQ